MNSENGANHDHIWCGVMFYTVFAYNIKMLSLSICSDVEKFPNLQTLEVFGLIQDSYLAILCKGLPHIQINTQPFSTVARPTAATKKDRTLWGMHCRLQYKHWCFYSRTITGLKKKFLMVCFSKNNCFNCVNWGPPPLFNNLSIARGSNSVEDPDNLESSGILVIHIAVKVI